MLSRLTTRCLLALLLAISSLAAMATSSANFVLPANAVNNAGLSGTSANFQMDSSLGSGFATPNMSSANFNLKPEFQPMVHLFASAPAITSANNVTFTVNSAGTFTVTATGVPVPTLSVTGALPTGVTFTPATGVLAGTPASGTAGVYPLTFGAANGNLPDASQAFTLTVVKTNQTITFNPQGAQTYVPGGVFTINPLATSTSGLAVTYSSLTSAVCTVSGINVNILAAGTCTIAANQPGDGVYNAAPQVTQGVNIAKRNQAITFGAISSKTFNASPLAVSASATSGLAVVFTSATTGVCTVSGTSVTFVTVGTCTIDADQPGDANTNAAPQVPQSFLITQGVQIISFPAIGTQSLGATINVSATASSGLTVSIASQTTSVCTVSGSSVTMISVGQCTLQATQAGNANYSAAAPVQQSFSVIGSPNPPILLACIPGNHKATCTFLPPIPNGVTVTGYTLSCRLGSNTPVQASGASSPLTVLGLTNGRLYLCTVTASSASGASAPSNSFPVLPFSTISAHGTFDLDGDGKADILLRAGDGNSSRATLDDNNHLQFIPIQAPGPEWRVLGVGDFGGAHRSDLLIQNIASGDVHVWYQFDGPPDGDSFLRNVKPGWVVETIADLDGDGKSDIVWRYVGSPLNPPTNPDDVGVVFVWFMNGPTISEIKARGGAPVSWNLINAADLDGDGMGDLVWQSPIGTARGIFGLTGRNFINKLLGNVPAGFTLLKAADFNGDGNADCLFRDAAGNVKIWLLNGSTHLSDIDMPAIPAGWQFYAAADLNGDGVADIVWKKPDGTLVLWLMNATTPTAPTVVDPAGTAPTGFNVIE